MRKALRKDIFLSDTGVVFNPATGDSFSVNPVGLDILRLLSEGHDDDALRTSIMEVWEVDATTFNKDYSDFLQLLNQHKLLQ